ncbi:MAG: hypothetical protein LAN71_01720 [Acidobacteriia bacterium]|nr:hypothetical protein [Terriglobia bacterium]
MKMLARLAMALSFLLFAAADAPVTCGQSAGAAAGQSKEQSKGKAEKKPNSAALRPESRLELVRFVSGEFVHVRKPLPGGKQGFLLRAGRPLDQQDLDRLVTRRGAAVNTGDPAQITHLEFRAHDIVVDINGGGRIKKRWRDRLQIQLGGGGMPMPTTRTTTQENGPAGIQPGMGSTIFLEFGKAVPDLTPEELKGLLDPLLDFSKQRSAAVQWIDTLPPEMKKAIQERRAVEGMDREMVVAALGKPERKVRERDEQGNEIEDWIYGQPPAITIFVRFQGERVTRVKQFPK